MSSRAGDFDQICKQGGDLQADGGICRGSCERSSNITEACSTSLLVCRDFGIVQTDGLPIVEQSYSQDMSFSAAAALAPPASGTRHNQSRGTCWVDESIEGRPYRRLHRQHGHHHHNLQTRKGVNLNQQPKYL